MKKRISLALGVVLVSGSLAAPSWAQEHDLEAIGKALANPVSDVWALFTEFDFAWNDGDINGGSDRVSYTTLFQPVMPIKFTENSKLITRPTLPIIWSQPVPSGIDRGSVGLGGAGSFRGFGDVEAEFDRKHGLGDLLLPLLYSPNDALEIGGGQMAWGLGPTFGFPTATDKAFKSDQFQAGPAGILVWKNDKVTLGAFPQYWWSYADIDDDAKDVSRGNLLYFFFYNLPNAWQVGFNPVVTYDHEASSGNKWNVPIGITVAKTTKVGNLPVKFQVGAEYSVVRQDDFGKRFMIKFNVIPVIPPLLKEPLF